MDIVCAFLAILEAVKTRMVSVFQNRMFGDIVIRPNTEVQAFEMPQEQLPGDAEPINGEEP
jgi:chromatin segregation and condensation protein Rec8/ScpA/Scc1 (kleisin family)